MKAICNTSPIVGLSIIGHHELLWELLLKPLGLLGILKLAKQQDKISEIKPLVDLLVLKKFRISKKIINQLLKEVGEL